MVMYNSLYTIYSHKDADLEKLLGTIISTWTIMSRTGAGKVAYDFSDQFDVNILTNLSGISLSADTINVSMKNATENIESFIHSGQYDKFSMMIIEHMDNAVKKRTQREINMSKSAFSHFNNMVDMSASSFTLNVSTYQQSIPPGPVMIAQPCQPVALSDFPMMSSTIMMPAQQIMPFSGNMPVVNNSPMMQFQMSPVQMPGKNIYKS